MDASEKVMKESDKYTKFIYYMTMIIAGCSVLLFLVVLICALVVVPQTVTSRGQTLENFYKLI